MPRVKRGVTARARHKKIIALAKGYRGRRNNVYRGAMQAVMRAGQYAYRDRRNKKRASLPVWQRDIHCYDDRDSLWLGRLFSCDGHGL